MTFTRLLGRLTALKASAALRDIKKVRAQELWDELYRPAHGGVEPGAWFQACRAWVHAAPRPPGDEPGGLQHFEQHSAHERRDRHAATWPVALAHVAAACAAAAALRLDQVALRRHAREVVLHLETARNRDPSCPGWTPLWAAAGEQHPDGEDDAEPSDDGVACVSGPDGPRWLELQHREMAAGHVARAFEVLRSAILPSGVQAAAEPPMEFWSEALDLTLAILDTPRPALGPPQTIQTLFVSDAGPARSHGRVMTLRLERVPHGRGVLYAAPELSFVARTPEFRGAASHASATARDLLDYRDEATDVRWSLTGLRDEDRYPDRLEGPSLGGAFALGLMALAVSAAGRAAPT
jgi:hypothetical protein